MSAVVEAVGDLVGGVVDAVGDAVEWVGDTVSNVVESVMDDPLKAVVQVAAVATGNAWALPIIEGVDVLEEGGSIEDALKSAALTYAVQTGVNFAMDSFGAAGATSDVGSGTTQFFDDGSSIQLFDDGSRLITDTAGKVTSASVDDVVGAAQAAGESGATTYPVSTPEVAARDLPSLTDDLVSPVEITGTEQAGFIQTPPGSPYRTQADLAEAIARGEDIGARYRYELGNDAASFGYPPRVDPPVDVAGAAAQSVDEVAAAGAAPTVDPAVIAADDALANIAPAVDPAIIAADDALASKGAYYPDTNTFVNTTLPNASAPANVAVAPDGSMLDDIYANLPESMGNVVARDPNATQYASMEDLLYDKGVLTDAQYKDLTGVAPVVDRSIPAGPMSNVSVVDAAKDLGGAVLDYAVANPLTTAGVIGGGLALAGAVSGDSSAPAAKPGEAPKRTITYGAAPDIRRTGLDQLYSASANIYGPRGATGTPGSTLPPSVQFQSSFQPLLGGAAPGAARVGLGSLGQGFSYTPLGSPQTFDISTLTPEQIVQLQDAMSRRRSGGGGG